MVKAISTDKKGIYRDLYRTLEFEKKQDKPANRQRKGIYANLYRQLEDDKNVVSKQVHFKGESEKKKTNFLSKCKKIFNELVSQVSYFFSSAKGKLKVLMFFSLVAKQPINSYIENNSPIYTNYGNYYNGR